MNTFLSQNDIKIKEIFKKISSTETFSDYIKKIAKLIYIKSLDQQNLNKILHDHNINNITEIKGEVLDMLLEYINYILDDNFLTENESGNLKLLKRFFKIKEGDFYKYRFRQIESILDKQFQFIYSDNKVNSEEALYKVGLQEIFDLGYDQFLELVNEKVKAALERGANSEELDTIFLSGNQIRSIENVRKKKKLNQLLSKIFTKRKF